MLEKLSRFTHTHWWLPPLFLYLLMSVVTGYLGYTSLYLLAEIPTNDPLPGYSTLFTTPGTWAGLHELWDGQWYRSIVEWGYQGNYSLSSGELTNWAFFPLFPALIWVLTSLGLPFWLAGSLLNFMAGLAGTLIFFRMSYKFSKSLWAASFTLVLLLASPAFFIMQATYTEGLGLLFVALALSGLVSKRYGVAFTGILLLAFTRGLGIPLFLVILVHLFLVWRAERHLNWKQLLLLPAGAFAAGFWPLTVGISLGSLTASMELLTIWTTSARYALWVPLVIGLVAYVLHKLSKSAPTEWRAWSLIYLVYVTATTVVSMGLVRYGLVAFVPLPVLFPKASQKIRWFLNGTLLLVLLALGALGQALWFTYVWIPTSPLALWSISIP